MDIWNFEIGKIYKQKDLIDAFGGSFLRPRGITPINSKNIIVLISYHYGRNRYEDKLFENDIMYYSGEGTDKDQTLTGRNKSIYEAKEKGKALLLFIVLKKGEYKYFGEVEVVGELQYKSIIGDNGETIKAIRFPLMQKKVVRSLTEYEMRHIMTYGVSPVEKPIVQVVGAAIIKNGKLLCAQRGYGSLIGKWEFPGGKVKSDESDQDALIREIKEELNINVEVEDLIDENYNEYPDSNINLKVYRCKYISGEIRDSEHQSLKWAEPEEIEKLDWADADKPIVESYLDSIPNKIDGEPLQFDYFEAEAVKPNSKELIRAVQDYEKSQKTKQKSGENAELAVMRYERDKLNNLGYPELADLVTQISKNNSVAGYDIKSYDVQENGSFVEAHIEVKAAKLVSKFIEFFISENELNKFKTDPNHKIYCLIKMGRKYKLHEVNKTDFFAQNYLSPMSYRVRIRIAE